MTQLTSRTDLRVVVRPVRDRTDPLVDARQVPSLFVDPRIATARPTCALLRATVIDRLVVAQSLLPRGVRLLLVEGYRPDGVPADHYDGWEHEHWQAHPTGAAADLTLCTAAGLELPMGTPVHAAPSQPAVATDAPGLPAPARANRAILRRALSQAGLVNLPTAWWHWSYGDRFWCHCNGSPATVAYGPADLQT